MKELSNQLINLPPSATMAVTNKAAALRAAGRDVIALAGGDPDFATPQHIVDAAFAAIQNGATHYAAPSKGTVPAVEAIAAKYERDTGVSVNPGSQIIVTPGGKWGINLALGALVNPGDEVMVLEPVWVSYVPLIRLQGGVPIGVSLPSERNFEVTKAQLDAHVSPKTKAIMVNSPCNPTGRVLTQGEIDAIVAFAIEHDLYVIYDELYEHLIYDGEHLPLGGLPGMAERTITINGLSKAYAMTGWRLGWMVGPESVMKLAGKLHGQTITCATTYGMDAIVAALNGSHDIVWEMRDSYRARRDFMVEALNAIEGIECRSIEGAFYLFPRFTKTALNSAELATALLEQAEVAGTPGIAFGAAGKGHLRFSIATAMHDLERAVERMARVVPQL
ncbi:MAG: pyridoxal phosphate-dependent aminotransferase [Candidatus Promineifilaceae bacterium]